MIDCCSVSNEKEKLVVCPSCKNIGKQMKIITLKSLLLPKALELLQPETRYHFCAFSECDVVYFNEKEQIFTKSDLKVPVYQKNDQDDTPICYCFGWTRKNVSEESEKTEKSTIVQNISMHIKAQRCGCEMNNPQGSCCLGNVTGFIKRVKLSK
ncbi:putative iron-sulfur cluster-binding metallochaperone [Bacillus sp. 03113]|uniref:putative iron-sulfur cluster-binding metallochaperone n=1 Tax=Bacillus sp. 03113 TaxID=2578211 RepID=UPI001143AADD|nr:(2Fe-2S)-binding protein [Bacillus sp. 03113]